MDQVYKRLAQHLDRIPNGYPETESGVELRILAKFFAPEEAALACELTLHPVTPKELAQQLHRDEWELRSMLKGMLKKGLIDAERGQGSFAYKLLPFVVGFWEHQNAQIDEELARLFEEYYHEALHRMMTIKPSVHRVIPVEESIPVNIEIMPYERASTYIENSQSWGVLNCICRVQKRLIGQGCDHTVENCLAFSSRPGAFERTDAIRAITKEDALQVLAQADKEGLVHSTSNVQDGVTYICNCCICSCSVLRGIAEYGCLDAMARSDFSAAVDGSLCTNCGTCVDRCQFNALSVGSEICEVNRLRCFGCGLCVTTCPTGAIRLVQKSESEVEPPPHTQSEWRRQRAETRGMSKDEVLGTREETERIRPEGVATSAAGTS